MFSKTTPNNRHNFRSLNDILDFGKYKGMSIKDVYKIDASYLLWAIENINRFDLPEELELRIEEKADEERHDYYVDNLDYEDFYDYCDDGNQN
jgi:hypothetical protein